MATLTVYNEGLNTTNWLVTAPSATRHAERDSLRPGLDWDRRLSMFSALSRLGHHRHS